MPNNWEQYAAPAGGNKWDQYAQAEPVPPTSGLVGAAPVPEGLQGPPSIQEGNREALQRGLPGIGKSVLGTIGDTGALVNKLPVVGNAIAPKSEVDYYQQHAKANNPDEEAGKVFGDIAQMAIPTGEAAEALPSAKRAGQVFESIAKDAANAPVNLSRSGPILEELKGLGSTGSNLPKAVRQLINTTKPPVLSKVDAARVLLGGEVSPLTDLQKAQKVLGYDVDASPGQLLYPKARQFASRISNSSIAERLTSDPNLKRVLGSLREGFNADVGDAANAAGRGQDYEQAMREYANAKKLQRVGAAVGTVGLGAAAKGAGLGAALHVLGKVGGQ
jgi:hypothetical protein